MQIDEAGGCSDGRANDDVVSSKVSIWEYQKSANIVKSKRHFVSYEIPAVVIDQCNKFVQVTENPRPSGSSAQDGKNTLSDVSFSSSLTAFRDSIDSHLDLCPV